MPKATRALGTTLTKGTTTPVTIGSLTSINGIEITADTIDVTTLDSTGGYKEYIGGFKDAGEVSAEGYFDSSAGANQVDLQSDLDDGLVDDYTINFPTTPTAKWTFKGIVTNFKVGDAEMDGTISFSVTIKVSGKPTLATTI
ncbi:MAG: phage tail tube protein [Porphyromonadaceae bacterium]|nr:phage tail tube protein [Porphyromonadaceae bacterium]